MDDHDGERYLLLLVEQILANGGHGDAGPWTIDNAGAALVAVDAVDRDVVARVRDDLALGVALRRPTPDATQLAAGVAPIPSDGATGPFAPAGADTPAGAFPPMHADAAPRTVVAARAVATGPNRFDTPDGLLTVESVSFGRDGATLVERLEAGGSDADPFGGSVRRTRRSAPGPPSVHDPMRPLAARSPRPHRRWSETGAGDHRLLRPAPRGTGPGAPPRSRPVGAGREQLRVRDDQGREYRCGPGELGGGAGGWRWVSALEPVPDASTSWLEVVLGEAPPFRLEVTPAGKVARGRPHGRHAGASWLLGALQRCVADALRLDLPVSTGAVGDGVDALVALGWIQPAEPLLDQLALLDAYPDGAVGLDPTLGSPLAGRDRTPPRGTATLPLARVVDLGERAARLDVATLDGGGLRLSGWFSPWSADYGPDDASGWRITGFDDRHNHYVATVADVRRGPAGADVSWQLWPALDPAARSLRLGLAGATLEASVEVVVE